MKKQLLFSILTLLLPCVSIANVNGVYNLVELMRTTDTDNSGVVVSVWDGSSNTSWYDESMSEYHLTSAAELKGLADLVDFNKCTFANKTIYLETDVDLNNLPWYPIGLHNSSRFDGNFDGRSHSITNMLLDGDKLDYPDMKDNLGFFGYALNANISNLKLQGSIIVTSNKYIGGLAARVNKIENIYCDITTIISSSISNRTIGGVAANVDTISNVYCKGNISFSDNCYIFDACTVGGIAGWCGEISQACSNVDINIKRYGQSDSQTQIGGVTGSASTMRDIIFTGSVSVTNVSCTSDMFIAFTGGITGRAGMGDRVISAPNYMAYGKGWAKGKSIITSGYNSEASFTNTYYVSSWANEQEQFGTPTTEKNLSSGVPLEGFSSDIWNFEEGKLPYLKLLKELEPKEIYTVTYYVDGVEYQIDKYYDGQNVIPAAEPTKEGYTFSGWDYVPPFISGSNWNVYGTFTINNYTISYMVDDEICNTVSVEYNSYITPPTMPYRSGCHFKWGEYPSFMPAYDITIIGYYMEDSKEFVDLGLPSGLLWATHNIGAEEEQNGGEYFSWGETVPKEAYYWGTYQYCNGAENTLTKYNYLDAYGQVDNKNVLENKDDAATVNWGVPWRLPTLEETQELISQCTWEKIAANEWGAALGYRVTGPNGNTVFFPAAGVKQYQQRFYNSERACILTSTIFKDSSNRPNYACVFLFDEDGPHWWYGWARCWGYNVRPVTNSDPSRINTPLTYNSKEINGIYDIQGLKLPELQKGLNIVKMKDNSVRKVLKR